MAELRVLDDLDAAEIDAPANFGGGADPPGPAAQGGWVAAAGGAPLPAALGGE